MNFTSLFKNRDESLNKKVHQLTNYLKSQIFSDYLKFITNQHHKIFNMYQIMLIIFVLFASLTSYFFFISFTSLIIPNWGFYSLGGISAAIILISIRAFSELINFKNKSKELIAQNHNQIQNLLGIESSPQSLKKNPLSTLDKKKSLIQNFTNKNAWDTKECPICSYKMEFLKKECPKCKAPLLPPLPS